MLGRSWGAGAVVGRYGLNRAVGGLTEFVVQAPGQLTRLSPDRRVGTAGIDNREHNAVVSLGWVSGDWAAPWPALRHLG